MTAPHPDCVCGHSWSAHLPLAGSTVGRCTVDCLDRCGEYIASAPRQAEPDPAALDTAGIRAEHARTEFCCWCSPVEACRLLALCDALDAARADAERRRLAWTSACRDRSKIRHDMWAMQGQLAGAQQLRDQAAAALDTERARNERLVTQTGHVLNDLTTANRRAEKAEAERDQALAAHELVWDVDQWECQPCWERGITGVIPGVTGYTVAELRHIWEQMRAVANAYPLAEMRLACMAVGLVNQLQPLRDALANQPPTHLPLSEVLELAVDLARRTSAPSEADHG